MTGNRNETNSASAPKRKRRRTWWIVLGAVLGTGVLTAAGGTWWLSASSGVQAQGEQDCTDVPVENSAASSAAEGDLRDGVCTALASLTDAWHDQDAEAYGEVFTEYATYTTFAGTHYVGRGEIVSSHAALFDGPLSGTGLTNHYLSLRVITDDVVILTTRGDTYEGDTPGEPSKVQTYTLVYDNGEWKIASFHNTQRKPLMERIQYLWMPETVPAAER